MKSISLITSLFQCTCGGYAVIGIILKHKGTHSQRLMYTTLLQWKFQFSKVKVS